METLYLGVIIFIFTLACFDLYVGVSNDAVNFLNSAIGSRTAKYRTLILIAGAGVFFGCLLSNGMMDIARHGILNPSQYYFDEVMVVFLAVIVTDIVLLDMFNSLGLPTSTTVSMVFELMGAAFAFTLLKWIDNGGTHMLSEYINTSKALEIVISIFASVAIAFVVGALVQWLSRIVFTFNYKKKLKWKIGLFGGLAITAIIYFMLFKGLKQLAFMTPEVKSYIDENILIILGICFVTMTLLMQLLHALKVNVFTVIVLAGTFSLAMAFAGNDLVNFIGVPLAAFSSFNDFFSEAGRDPSTYAMVSLQESAKTPFIFLFAAGCVMVYSLATSKKAENVIKTSVGLGAKGDGDELFGSSRVARGLVRFSRSVAEFVACYTPQAVSHFINTRFVPPTEEDSDIAFDQVRASVNLVVASLLIALGTSLKLPLSTTYVTFMVAMGTSLADRAWTRESAVFRITGVLTVIGGWFMTAGVAFTAAFFVALAMKFGGPIAMAIIVAIAIAILIHSQIAYKRKQAAEKQTDTLTFQMMTCNDKEAITGMLRRHVDISASESLERYAELLERSTDALFSDRLRPLRQSVRDLTEERRTLKNLRRQETICLRRTPPAMGIRLTTDFHLVHNSLRQMLFGLMRIAEPACEHVDNNFTPIATKYALRYNEMRDKLINLMHTAADNFKNQRDDANKPLREECRILRNELSEFRKELFDVVQSSEANIAAMTLLLHLVQETDQFTLEVRLLIKRMRLFHEMCANKPAE